jgi:acyl CoA:acetate/3-ketoacid CoA transferase beta subunit
LRAWVDEWVLATDHAGYLRRLGEPRLEDLRAAALAPVPAQAADIHSPASPEERAATLAMRVAEREATAGRADTFFAGIGLAHLAAWAAEDRCRARGVVVALVAETGMVSFRPIEGDPYLFNRPNAASALFHNSFVQTLGVIAGPGARRCLALLAAAQIDSLGNINSSRSSDGRFIVGSGGANDLAAGGASCLVVMPLKEGRFVAALPFTTTKIHRLTAVATDLGLLERDENGRLRVAGVMCGPGAEHDTLAEIRRRCGPELSVVPDFARFDPPSENELASLRRFDPQRAILA